MKYYGMTISTYTIEDEVCEKFNLTKGERQYRLVIKAKSKAAANRRWCEITGDTRNIFTTDNYSETGNPTAIELCDEHEAIIGDSTYPSNYASLKEVDAAKKTLRELKN